MHSLVNIEAERARLGITREQLSAHLGVTSKTLRAWTAGRSALPSDKLVLMHELFNCSTDYLLGLSALKRN